MVEFKTWKDAYIFLKDYCNASCLNCFYNGSKVDLSEEHEDIEYVRVFCRENISMVRLDKGLICCAKWEHKESRKTIEEMGDAPLWNLSEKVLEMLDNGGKRTIDEIKEIVANESE